MARKSPAGWSNDGEQFNSGGHRVDRLAEPERPGISIFGKIVRIDNTNDVQISNVDFSLHGGAISIHKQLKQYSGHRLQVPSYDCLQTSFSFCRKLDRAGSEIHA